MFMWDVAWAHCNMVARFVLVVARALLGGYMVYAFFRHQVKTKSRIAYESDSVALFYKPQILS